MLALLGVAVLTGGLPMATTAVAAGNQSGPVVHVIGSYPHGYIEFTAAGGSLLHAAISVSNAAPAAETFLFTAVDGYTSPPGGVVYGNRQVPIRDGPSGNGEFGAGTWITLDQPQATLSPGGATTVNASIRVPAGVHPGDWVGGINAENPVPTGQTAGPLALQVTQATAIAVVVHVPGAASPGAIFLDKPTVKTVGSKEYLDIPLRYTGDLLTKPLFSFQIKDSSGKVVYQHSGRWDTFMPHTTMVYEVPLDPPLGEGDYTFTGTVGPDGHQQTFTFPLSVGSAPPSAPHQSTPGTIPFTGWWPGTPGWLQLLVIILPAIFLLLLLILSLRRRCSHCGRPRPWGLMAVSDYQEISHCRDCRAVARERRKVSLCPACYRSHVLPVAQEAATAR